MLSAGSHFFLWDLHVTLGRTPTGRREDWAFSVYAGIQQLYSSVGFPTILTYLLEKEGGRLYSRHHSMCCFSIF